MVTDIEDKHASLQEIRATSTPKDGLILEIPSIEPFKTNPEQEINRIKNDYPEYFI